MSKYGNRKTVVDGITFDSKLESSRYAFLKIMEKTGKIKDLKLQVKYVLQEGFVRKGRKYRPIIYIADFEYVENGITKTEDSKSKGTITALYKVKKKMLLYKYPDINFSEV